MLIPTTVSHRTQVARCSLVVVAHFEQSRISVSISRTASHLPLWEMKGKYPVLIEVEDTQWGQRNIWKLSLMQQKIILHLIHTSFLPSFLLSLESGNFFDWGHVADGPLWTHCWQTTVDTLHGRSENPEPRRRSGECDPSSASWGRTHSNLLLWGEVSCRFAHQLISLKG